MIRFGVMQGRLTPANDRGIQFFPFDNWKQEFYAASEIGLDEIEWIFDYDKYEENPLWTNEGCDEIRKIISETGVKVNAACFDYFMRRPFFKYEKAERDAIRLENQEFLVRVCKNLKSIGAHLLEIPLVDNSSVKTPGEEVAMIDFIREAVDQIDGDMFLGIESDYDALPFKEFLEKIGHGRVKANYDSGNSSGLGYCSRDEIAAYGNLIQNFHVKDRITGAISVQLGTGNANFPEIFEALQNIGYSRGFILQAARDVDGDEKAHIAKQLRFVKEYVEKYLQ